MAGRTILNVPAFSAGLLTTLCGTLVLIGWWLDVPQLKTVMTGLVSMEANAAICFTLAGVALALQASRHTDLTARIVNGCAWAVIVIGLLTLIEYLTGFDFRIDQLIFPDLDTPEYSHPGRMSLITSAWFIAAGSVMLLLRQAEKSFRVLSLVQYLVLMLFGAGAVTLLGYALDIKLLYNWNSFGSISLHSALGLFILPAGIWFYLRSAIVFPSVPDPKRITRVAASCLITATALTGLFIFSSIETQMERRLGLSLQATLAARITQIETTLGLHMELSRVITARPNLLKYLRLYAAAPETNRIREVLQNIISNFSTHGFSAITLYSNTGDILAHSGSPVTRPDVELRANDGNMESSLLWKGGIYLRSHLQIADAGGVLGKIVTEQYLPNTTDAILKAVESSQSAELLVCHEMGGSFYCLPSRLSPTPVVIHPQSQRQALLVQRALLKGAGYGEAVDYRGQRIIGAYNRVGKTDLVAILKVDSKEHYASIIRQFQLSVLIILLSTALGTLLIRMRVMPLAEALKASEADYQNLLESINDGVSIIQSGCFVYANHALCAMLGYTREEFTGLKLDAVIDPEFLELCSERYAQRTQGGSHIPPARYEIRMLHKGGSPSIWVGLNSRRTIFNKRPAVITINRDITQRKHEEMLQQKLTGKLLGQLEDVSKDREELYQQATRDPLTGLFNRRYLDETLKRELARATRDKSSLSLAMIDIDYFKRINDNYGHDAGDEMIKTLAALLLRQMRHEDIVCRYGGEEFVAVLPASSLDNARQRMEQIRQLFEKTEITWHGHKIHTTLSIGIAAYPRNGINNHELITAADAMLYQAKGAGRNRVMIQT